MEYTDKLRELKQKELADISTTRTEDGFTVWATEKTGLRYWLLDGSVMLDKGHPHKGTIAISGLRFDIKHKYCAVYDKEKQMIKLMAKIDAEEDVILNDIPEDYKVQPLKHLLEHLQSKKGRKLVKMFRDMATFENFVNGDKFEILQVDVKAVEQSSRYQEGFAAVVFYRELA